MDFNPGEADGEVKVKTGGKMTKAQAQHKVRTPPVMPSCPPWTPRTRHGHQDGQDGGSKNTYDVVIHSFVR